MNFDDITTIWQTSENHDVRISNEETLVRAVVRDYHSASIDQILNMVKLVPLLIFGVFVFFLGYYAKPSHQVYGWMTSFYYVLSGVFLWIPIFYTLSAWQQRTAESQYGDSVKDCLQRTLSQINHSIWLNRTIGWWCILPLIISSILGFYRSFHPDSPTRSEPVAIVAPIVILIVAAVLYVIYWRAKRSNRQNHLPRKERLEALINNIEGSQS